MLIQLAISRSREYLADEGGAHLAHPLSLAKALGKLEVASKRIPMQANPSTAHMFIVNPLKGGRVLSLFSTHPPWKKESPDLKRWPGQESFEK